MVTINGEKYLTIEEYSRLNSVSVQTTYNHIKKKMVVTRKVMNMTLIKQ
jgi:hypothetical protein